MIASLLLIFLSPVVYGGGNDDFRLGIQLCDHKPGENTGAVRYTPYASAGGGWSVWAGDSNYYDPDGMRIGIFAPPPPPPPPKRKPSKYPPKYRPPPPPPPRPKPFRIENKDIRLCIQLTDHAKNSKGNPSKNGRAECTPWASAGGGWSKYAGDSNFYDYDAVRVKIDVKPRKGLVITNIRAGLRMTDDGKNKKKRGAPQFTKWFAQAKNTWSDWAGDSNFYDADSIQIYLDVECPQSAETGLLNWDNDIDGDYYDGYNNNYGGYEIVMNGTTYNMFLVLIGVICVLMVINIACCYVYYNNRNKNRGYKAVSYNTDTDV